MTENSKEILAIVQARTTSTRLPGKALLRLGGMSMVEFQLRRIAKSKLIRRVVLATSEESSDDELSQEIRSAGFDVFRGDLEDVLGRYHACAAMYGAEVVVRLTGDCPLSDPEVIDETILEFLGGDWDYLSNSADGDALSVPDGFDVEVFRYKCLEDAAKKAQRRIEREHVTPWLRSTSANLKWSHYRHKRIRPYYRVTVDDEADYKVVTEIVDALDGLAGGFGVDEVVDFLDNNPDIAAINLATLRNEGSLISGGENRLVDISPIGAGQELWERAKKVIPGGNMLLSKRAEIHLPGKWPTYFSRAKGCRVWDLNGREYIDMSTMGVGTNLLGYGHPEVDSSAVSALTKGNMSTLNCPEEVWLAERLVEMHPWSDMARFARSGGEANAIAIRIARAATGRDAVAVCGYHGWHDWYLAANLRNEDGLKQHLLPGLPPTGVPIDLEGSTIPFSYNCLDQIKEIAEKNCLAAIKMEVQRSVPPDRGFLEGVRELCTKEGIVLILDECTSGFRETFGGLHLKYKCLPDMAVFGKTLGNGYSITAVLGKREVMQAAQNTFISSTFWTERIGPAAALKTLDVMERESSWLKASKTGLRIRQGWQDLADDHGIEIEHNGIDALPGFSFKSSNPLACKTLLTQEMLKKGYLAGTSFYASLAHTNEIVDEYLEDLGAVFDMIASYEDKDIMDLLEGPICHNGFKRLN